MRVLAVILSSLLLLAAGAYTGANCPKAREAFSRRPAACPCTGQDVCPCPKGGCQAGCPGE